MGKQQTHLAISLQAFMEQRGMNPRGLSLAAGLNETAVRDIIAGRARFPRYDTVQALAKVLGTTPAYLMGDSASKQEIRQGKIKKISELELLTEIIARVQEVSETLSITPPPKLFARIVTTLYQRVLANEKQVLTKKELQAQVLAIYDYENLNNAATNMANKK